MRRREPSVGSFAGFLMREPADQRQDRQHCNHGHEGFPEIFHEIRITASAPSIEF